tara:strand:+ start:409 stop:612 length:204 start_codon:yes stop_codon:yes gene_type:complete
MSSQDKKRGDNVASSRSRIGRGKKAQKEMTDSMHQLVKKLEGIMGQSGIQIEIEPRIEIKPDKKKLN